MFRTRGTRWVTLTGILIVVLPFSHAANGCRRGAGGLHAVHTAVVKTANLCFGFHNDVYQRFSGYVVKYRIGQLCEGTLAVLDSLRHVALAVCGGRTAAENAAVEAAEKLRRLSQEAEAVLVDTNAAGDGSLYAALAEQLNAFAGHLLHLHEYSLRSTATGSPEPNWKDVVEPLASHLAGLFEVLLEQMSDSVTYNIASLNVSNLPRFMALLDGFPAAAPIELKRPEAVATCHGSPVVYRAQHVHDAIADPPDWRSRDVAGVFSPRPSVQKLLFTISKAVPLSYNVVAIAPRVQVGAQELTSEYKRMFAGTGGLSAPSSETLGGATAAGAEPQCEGLGLAYNPAHCLFDRGWGSMMFSLSTEPPFDGVLAVSEMSQKGKDARPRPFVQPVANESGSLEQLIDLVDGVYKSLNTPSPDLLFLSPMVGNCLTLRRFGPSRRGDAHGGSMGKGPAKNAMGSGGQVPQLTPKLVWIPVNPLVAPPWELAPNFTAWHEQWLRAQSGSSEEKLDESLWWYAQCSLASAVSVLSEQGYVLLHLEHAFAVFILKGLLNAVTPLLHDAPAETGSMSASLLSRAGGLSLYDHWLCGWFCSPVAPTLFGLDWGVATGLNRLHDRQADVTQQYQALCDFIHAHDLPLSAESTDPCDPARGRRRATGEDTFAYTKEGKRDTDIEVQPAMQSWRALELKDLPEERGKAYLLESSGRGRCLSQLGFCECFPPYRGRFCEESEPGRLDTTRSYQAVLHYLAGDHERLLRDFEQSLPLLWERFNSRFDYPVVVFHDGLAPKSRQRILEASRNRVWFAYVENYASVPAFLRGRMDLDLGGYSVGYRGMCRFRSGPIFVQPVMQKFDYAWTLDTDGYFPAAITVDPFEQMHQHGHVYGYSHVSRDQASAVQHFWEFCRLYMESKGLDPKGSRMLRRITDALVLRDTYWHEWNRVLFMNDIEVVKLSWFRSHKYQDFFHFLDSTGGFWLYRWGDHAVRTIAIALFLEPMQLMRMGVPYGHQGTCRCGDEHLDSVCKREGPSGWWRCVPRGELQGDADNTVVSATGDMGTVHDDLLFGGD